MESVANDEFSLSQSPVIRTFASMREIRGYPGFRDNNPISKTNYKCISGDYNLPPRKSAVVS
jgi:hypothetical protein